MSYKPPFIEPGSRVPPGVFYQQQLLNLPHGPLSPPFIGQGLSAMSPHLAGGLSPPSVGALPELSYARYLAPGYYSPQLRHPASEPVGYLPPHLAFDSGYMSDAAFPRNPYPLGDYRRTDHLLGSPGRMVSSVPLVITPDNVSPDLVKKHPTGPPNLPSPPVLQRAPGRSNISGPPPLTRAPEHIIPLSSPGTSPSQKTVGESQASRTETEKSQDGPPLLKWQNNTEKNPIKNVDCHDNKEDTMQTDHSDQSRTQSHPPVITVPTVATDMSPNSATKVSDTKGDSPLPIILPSTSPALSDSSTSTFCATPLAELSPSPTGLSKEEAQAKFSKLLESNLDMTPGVLWTRPRDGRHQCNLCNYVTSRLNKMEQHLIAHKGKLICDGCGKAFIKQCDLDRHKVAKAKGRSRSCDISPQFTAKQQLLQTPTEALEPTTATGAKGMKGTLVDWTGDDSGMSFSLVHVNPDDSSDDSTFAVTSDKQQSACSNDDAQYTIGKAPSDAPSTTSLAMVINKAPLAAATNNPACSSHALHATTAAASLLTCSVRNVGSNLSSTDATKTQSSSAPPQETQVTIEVSDEESDAVLPSGEKTNTKAPASVTLESPPPAEKNGRNDKQQKATSNETYAPRLVGPPFERIVIVPDGQQSTSGPPSIEDTTWTERLTGILNKRAFPLIHSHSNSRVIEYSRNRSHNQRLEPIVAPYFQMPVMGPVFPYPTLVQDNQTQPSTGDIGAGFPRERKGSESERWESSRHDSLSVLRAQLERGVTERSNPDQSAADSGSKYPDGFHSKPPIVGLSNPAATSISIENRPLHPTPEAEKEVNSFKEASTVFVVHSDGQEDRMQIKEEPGLLNISTNKDKSAGREEQTVETSSEAQVQTATSNIASSDIAPGNESSSTVQVNEDTIKDSLLEDPDGLNPMEPNPFPATNDFPVSVTSDDLDSSLVKDFRCKLCNYTGRSLHCLIKHYKAHKITHKICKYCEKAFERPSDLTRHVLRHHKSNIEGFTSPGKNREIDFNSDIATFTDYKKMKQMARMEENSDLFQCDRCKYSTTKMQELLLHRKKKHISWFFCEVCGAKFISQLALANHRHQTHELNDPLPNPVPYFDNTQSTSEKSVSTSENTEGNVSNCRTASDKFELKSLLFRHIKNRHKNQHGYLRCDKCTFKTRKAQRLLQHLVAEKSHTRWSCGLCDSKFIVEDSISHKPEVHESDVPPSNTPEKSALCQPTLHASQLYQRTSQSDTIYSCSLCSFMKAEFRSKQALAGHIRTNHNDKDYLTRMSALDEAEITWKIIPRDPSVLRLDTYTSGVLLKTSLCHARVDDDNLITLDFTEVTPQQMEKLDVPFVSAVEDAKQIMHKLTTDPFCSSPMSVILHKGCQENREDSTSAMSVEITSGRQKQDAESKKPTEQEDLEKEHVENCSESQTQDSPTAANVLGSSPVVNSPSPSTKVATLPEKPTLPSDSLASTVITLTPVRSAANQKSNRLGKMSPTPAISVSQVTKDLSLASDSNVLKKALLTSEVYREVPSASNSTVFEQLPIPTSKPASKNQQGLYSCTKCSYSTNIEAKYDEHLVAHKGKFICKLCSKAFIKTSDLTRHWLTHGKMDGNKYLCDSCEYSTASRAALETHMKNHYCKMYMNRQINKNVKCSSCGGKFLRREFWKHVKEVHGGMKGIKFKGKKHKRLHRASHTEAYRCQTSQISVDVSSTSSNVESFDISTKALPFATNVNPTSVINISPNDYLSELVDDDDGVDGTCRTTPFEGNVDGNPTPSTKVKRRKRSHHGKDENDGSLMCIYCDKSFSSIERLENHLNLHERSYCSAGKRKKRVECPECHKIFCNAYYLADHMHLHTGEKPHVCEFCGKGFSIPQCLSSHKSQGKCPNMPGGAPRDKKRLKKKKPTWYKPRVRRRRRSSAFALSTNCPPPPVDGTTLTHIIETETEEGVVVNEDTVGAHPSSS